MINDSGFDSSRDVSECPNDCRCGPWGRDFCGHRHCASFGCILEGEGGGGDDGRQVSGYHDQKGNAAVKCDSCGREVCPDCINGLDGRKRCYNCSCAALLKSLTRAA